MVGVKLSSWDNYIPDPKNKEYKPYSEIATAVAEKTLLKSGSSSDNIDLLISLTETSDYFAPQAGCLIKEKLNLSNSVVINLNDGLGGFNQGISVASQFLYDNTYSNALVLVGESIHGFLDDSHWSSEFYRDGVTAIYLQKDDSLKKHILALKFCSFGEYYDLLQIRSGGSRCPITSESIFRNEHRLNNYKDLNISNTIENIFRDTLESCLKESQVTPQNIDYYILSNAYPGVFYAQKRVLSELVDIEGKVCEQDSYCGFSTDIIEQLKKFENQYGNIEGKTVFVFEISLGLQCSGLLLRI